MDALEMLQGDIEAETRKIRDIVDAADKEGREVSEVERTSVKASMDRLTELKIRKSSEEEKDAIRQAIDGFYDARVPAGLATNPVREPASPKAKARDMGTALVSTEAFKSWALATKESGKAPQFTTPNVEVAYKGAGDPILESGQTEVFGSGSGGPYATIFGLEAPGLLTRELMVADLLPSVPITVGNSAAYPIVKTRPTLTGTSQTEGSAKEGAVPHTFEWETAALETKAAWIKVSSQFLEDAPGLAAYVNADLPYAVRVVEDAYLTAALYSAAGAADAITGGGQMWDSILDAATTVRNSNGTPNAFLINPNDWAILLSEQFTGGFGYVGGGPFQATGSPWNLRPVVTASATEGAPLVGDFNRGARVFRRGGMSVSSTNADGTDFQKNIITIRAELRLVIGVTYPELFVEATVTS